MQRTLLAAAIAGLFTLPVQAEETYSLDEIVVSATRVQTPDVAAPYASEVHTRRMIEQSGAGSLYDYLARYTSVQVLPSYGNRYTPKLDMRGYGIGDGYQNLVVTLDGRRLNNIDGAPQLIGAIPLADIERIEITKGSGSVMFGDGATAGSIQVYRRAHQGVSLAASAGNHGALAGSLAAGLSTGKLTLSASADYSSQDGDKEADVTGHTDAASNRTWHGGLVFRPAEQLELGLEAGRSRIDSRYTGYLSLAQFNANPAQNGDKTYTQQALDSDVWRVHAGLEISRDWRLTASHSQEDKRSRYVASGWTSDYDYAANDLALQYRGDALDVTAGLQSFDGTRIGSDNRTAKDNLGYYLQGQYRLDGTTVSAGVRREKVDYAYDPAAGAAIQSGHRLTAWDLGVNQRLNERLALFGNLNRGFQAPDIDRFFATDFSVYPAETSFNGFITPATSHTLNLGLNHVTPVNRLKLTLFRANLDHEIYYFQTGPWSGYNTNLDQTHKYGLELQDTWRAMETLTARLNYSWTRAVIDRENEGGGAFNGKDLPGVPRHGVVLGLTWQASPAVSLDLNHAWRSSAYAANDFANSASQKQASYQATDLALRYRQKNLEWFAAVDNVFAHKNGLWVSDDVIYPVNFTRHWRLGMKATF